MSTMIRNSLKRAVAVLMSFLLVFIALAPTGGGKAYAGMGPYTPIPPVSSGYTGPLTWKDYTAPYVPSLPPAVTTSVYVPLFLDIDNSDNIFATMAQMNTVGPSTTYTGKVAKISNNGQTETDITNDGDFKYPVGVAVGNTNNVYVANNITNTGSLNNQNNPSSTVKMLSSGSDSWTTLAGSDPLEFIFGVAVDDYGTVYAIENNKFSAPPATPTPPRILKLPSGNGTWQDITGTASPFFNPSDIAVDGAGNVFVSDLSSGSSGGYGKIYKLPVGDTVWIDISPKNESDEFIPFGAYGIGVDKFDNLHAINLVPPGPPTLGSLLSGSAMKLGYGKGSKDWTTAPTMANPMFPVISFDIAANSSGHIFGTSLITANIVRLMASIIYVGNGHTGGQPPVDNAGYLPTVSASVYGNVGNLEKEGFVFGGWTDNSGTTYAPGDTIPMSQSVTLSAIWNPIPTFSNIALDSASYSLVIGSTHQSVVSSVYTDNSKYPFSSEVTFSSSLPSVATVNGEGLVTAVAVGETVISAVYGSYQAQATVTVSSPPASGPATTPKYEVYVDGVKQDALATMKEETVNGQKVSTIVVDSQKVMDKMEKDKSKLLTLPLSGNSQVVVGRLTGALVKSLESNDAQIQIVTDRGTYTLPASQINIDSISAQVGTNVKLEDIVIEIRISETTKEKASQVESAAKNNQFELIGSPVDFEVTASYGSQSKIEANKFNSYVERMIALPKGTEPNSITTGVVLTINGQLFHVPTYVVTKDGKMYAVVNSLTNSTYSVIHNTREMDDVKNHWARADVNDMNSRLIIQGVNETEFRPDAAITRAEFAAIVTRGLGIQGATYAGSFSDVAATDWFAGAVQAAVNYKLFDGYEDGKFRPNQNISRQEATAVLSRAASIAKLKTVLPAAEVSRLLSQFTDGSKVASWAQANVAAAISLNLMNGRGDKLDVSANLTRAETAALVRRLLQAAKLINE